MENKTTLRRKFITKRQALSPEIVTQKSADIARQVLAAVDWNVVRTLHCFLPLVDSNEPDLRAVIEAALQKGVTVYTSDPLSSTNRQVKKLQNEQLQAKIKQFALVDQVQFDVIFIPMLAYDPSSRHRLGFGGGFYDRMLVDQRDGTKIGVCFSEFTSQLPIEPHDVPLDDVITA